MVHYIVCQDTKDEDVVEVLAAKDRTQRAFNDAIRKAHA